MATGTSHPNYICAGNNTNNNSVYRSIIRPCAPDLMVNKRNGWDLPTILNLTARSLSEEKLDELQVNVTIHDVSIMCDRNMFYSNIVIRIANHKSSSFRAHRVVHELFNLYS